MAGMPKKASREGRGAVSEGPWKWYHSGPGGGEQRREQRNRTECLSRPKGRFLLGPHENLTMVAASKVPS